MTDTDPVDRKHLVTWAIELIAKDPTAAALQALAMIRDEDSVVFEVYDGADYHLIDLIDLEDPEHPRIIEQVRINQLAVLRTESGKELTDDDIQALADEAERGYDINPEARP
jgi:hypothetical protein